MVHMDCLREALKTTAVEPRTRPKIIGENLLDYGEMRAKPPLLVSFKYLPGSTSLKS